MAETCVGVNNRWASCHWFWSFLCLKSLKNVKRNSSVCSGRTPFPLKYKNPTFFFTCLLARIMTFSFSTLTWRKQPQVYTFLNQTKSLIKQRMWDRTGPTGEGHLEDGQTVQTWKILNVSRCNIKTGAVPRTPHMSFWQHTWTNIG